MKKEDVKIKYVINVGQYSRKLSIWKDIVEVRRKLFVPAVRKLFATLTIINDI